MLADPSRWWNDPEEAVEECEQSPQSTLDYKPRESDQKAIAAAAQFFGIGVEWFEGTLQRAYELEAFLGDAEYRFGRDAEVRIRTDVLYRVRDKGSLSESQFRVLCAVFSKIGSANGPKRIRHKEIRYRAAGFRSESLYLAFDRQPGLPSIKQVRNALDSLVVGKLFSRFCTGNAAYYQHPARMSSEELGKAVMKKRDYKRRQLREARDRERDLRIQRIVGNSMASEGHPEGR